MVRSLADRTFQLRFPAAVENAAHLAALIRAGGVAAGVLDNGPRRRTRRVVASFWQISAKFRQNVARFRLYRHRFLKLISHVAAFFEIHNII